MPRKHPVPEREREIGRRLLEARKKTGMSRVEFAKVLGIGESRLASYELGRVPLPYWAGAAFCRHAKVNQRRLATGQLPTQPTFIFPREVETGIERKDLFSEIYNTKLKARVEMGLQAW